MLSDYSHEHATAGDDDLLDPELVAVLDDEFLDAGGLLGASDLAEVLEPFFDDFDLDAGEIESFAAEFAEANELPVVADEFVYDRAAATLLVIALREDAEDDED